jgi:hypothetical protein
MPEAVCALSSGKHENESWAFAGLERCAEVHIEAIYKKILGYDAIVDLEHSGDRVRDLLGELPQASAARSSRERNCTIGHRQGHPQRRHRNAYVLDCTYHR